MEKLICFKGCELAKNSLCGNTQCSLGVRQVSPAPRLGSFAILSLIFFLSLSPSPRSFKIFVPYRAYAHLI